jgi:hypothetical protein
MHLPFLQRVLGLGPLGTAQWFEMPAVALTLLVVMELHKLSWRWRRARDEPGVAATSQR